VVGAQAIADHIEHDGAGEDSAFARELAMTWWFGTYSRPVTQVQQPRCPAGIQLRSAGRDVRTILGRAA
jgi:hypothetical protein